MHIDTHEPPVYRAAYELTIAVCRFVKDCHPDYKNTLGLLLQQEALRLEAELYRVNEAENNEQKVKAIQKVLDACYQTRMIIRLLIDLGIMKVETNIALNLKIEETAKQLAGWKKACGTGGQII
ncbi:MAG: four helix bundle protein [Patescibacteria group bacterium]|jgi:hypothetical protein